jgi:hypothetical protein
MPKPASAKSAQPEADFVFLSLFGRKREVSGMQKSSQVAETFNLQLNLGLSDL